MADPFSHHPSVIIKKMCSSSFVTNWQILITKQKLSFHFEKHPSLTFYWNQLLLYPKIFFFFLFGQRESCWTAFLPPLLCLRTKATKNDQYGNQDNSIKHFFICLPLGNATETPPTRKTTEGETLRQCLS